MEDEVVERDEVTLGEGNFTFMTTTRVGHDASFGMPEVMPR